MEFDVNAWFKRTCGHAVRFNPDNTGDVVANEAGNAFAETLARLFVHNATLWGFEDEVRRTDIADAEIAKYKRLIDRENQSRNDMIDCADAELRRQVEAESGAPDASLPLNTETPGSAFDRLTIIALRLRSLDAEINRADATDAHKEKCRSRKAEVEERAADLCRSLQTLLDDIFAGRKRLKSYGTHKLYNDPETNPAVRNAAKDR